jgi:hypothetical protein
VITVEFVMGYGAEMDSEPDGKGPEETGGNPLAPGIVVGKPVEFDRGDTVEGTGLGAADPVGVL